MSDLFKVADMDGKGLGCLALKDIKKGDLILKERLQCFIEGTQTKAVPIYGSAVTENITDVHMPKVMKAYSQMSKSDKGYYTQLKSCAWPALFSIYSLSSRIYDAPQQVPRCHQIVIRSTRDPIQHQKMGWTGAYGSIQL